MPFEPTSRRRIAIVGGGVSGLGAAHALAGTHEVTLFEAERRLGGHARTVLAGRGEKVAVDTGFIVYNQETYPSLCALFDTLGVPTKPTDMSFSASIDNGATEYSIDSPRTLFAQKRNALRPSFLRMAADIVRFGELAADPAQDEDISLGDWLAQRRFGRAFRDNYILCLAGAIWSAPPAQMLSFPAATLLRFFRNHRLLTNADRIPWRTVDGGSQEYVSRLERALIARGASIRLGAPVRRVTRQDGVLIESDGADAERFDSVILACHSDQALAMLGDASAEVTRVLGALRYAPGRIVLHDDARQMPQRRMCWSSWNARRISKDSGAASVTYWMNKLQSLPESVPLFATLNPLEEIPEAHVFDEKMFAHPIFDAAAMAAQRALPGIQGARDTWFCGAYARYGFHEDGLASGLDAADRLMKAYAL